MPINTELIFNPIALQKAAAKVVRKEREGPKLKKAKLHPDFNPHIKARSKKQRYYDRLAKFHGIVYTGAAHRLKALQSISKFGASPNRQQIQKTREAFDRGKWAMLQLDKCWVCHAQASHRHHIVPIVKSGTNIPDNLVGLCVLCHEAIHPFMVAVRQNMELDERLNYIIAKHNS